MGLRPERRLRGQAVRSGCPPELRLLRFHAGPSLGAELGQPPALLVPHPSALLLGGFLQLLLQGAGKGRGRLVGEPPPALSETEPPDRRDEPP